MMNSWPSLYREGALALSPHDVVKGHRELDALLEGAARYVRKRDTAFFFSYTIWTAILTGTGLVHLANMVRKPPSPSTGNVTLGIAFLSVVMLALTWRAWIALQNGKTGQRFGKLPDVSIPLPLQDLIEGFASGMRDARTAPGRTVPRELFAGQWAILLFSREASQRAWVRSPRGKREKDEIFAYPDAHLDRPERPRPVETPAEAKPDEDARISEPDLCNLDPAMARLVDGTDSDSGTRSREDNIKLVAAALDKANISKRDVKSHHIAERWNKNDGHQPDVGAVRSLMKGQQAGAPSKTKAARPADFN